MAVSTTDTYAGPFVPNGVTVEFPFTFKAMGESEIRVELIDADGTVTIVDQDTYDVTLNAAGGSVIFTSGPFGAALYVISDPSFLQEIAFSAGGAYRPETVNEANDRAAARDLVLKSSVDRAAVIPVQGATDGYIPVVRDGQFALEPSVDVQMEVVNEAVDRADDAAEQALEAAASVSALRLTFEVIGAPQSLFDLGVVPTVLPDVLVDGVQQAGPNSPSPLWNVTGQWLTLSHDADPGQTVTVEIGFASIKPAVLAENVLGLDPFIPIAPFSHAASYAPGTIGDRYKRCVFVTDAPYLASPTQSAAFNQAAFNQAIADVGEAGGGIVFVPAGNYSLTNANPPADIPDNTGDADRDVIIDMQYNNVQLVGDGRGATILTNTLANSSYSHFIKIGRRIPAVAPVHNVQVRNLSIVGNWDVGKLTGTVYTNSGIDVSNGCTNIRLEVLSITHCGGYAIGMQRDAFKFCAIRDVFITDIAYDGIDWKMDVNDSGYGNIVQHVTVLRFALVQDMVDGRQAGIDVRQGVDVRDCYVGEYGAGSAGVRVNTPFDNGFVKKSVIDNIKCYAATNVDTYGLHITGNGTQVSNIYTGGCEQDVWWRATNSQLVNLIANNGVNGLRIFAAAGETLQNCQFSNIRTTGNSGHGIRIDGDGTVAAMVFSNVVSISNTQSNLMIAANCNDLMFIGGDIPSGIQDSGVDTRFVGVSGDWKLRAGRNKTQYVETSGDANGNYLRGVSVPAVPKPFVVEADANSGDLVLNARHAAAYLRMGDGIPYTASADAPIVGYFPVKDAAGNVRKLAVLP
ncbi:hypothetical protein ASE85_02510 [Sphingobium sp. Leaf26]|uniref:glycosyl hydrolase family 28-related protein n=1 Tax=Sphingobium sp. Leaf26 TaxID=1735693 RepID=UPI0006FD3508|nr:glycosyl hydrolase family 28-related protein [Sphingobium sp. Leaf26]KQN09826.1 hypothetical protein ASE85_02510 [Sphingobium sp. Leaf26]